ncbi:fucose 4-O-acetylase-like acetyltransferase [Lewinella marina]|uniref:Acyltransferase 3 domain-containing protein n=1 Tax=Neolewinella marina TaxID=438751 RepID=A0A2G0CGA8_9BACT|nr:acyltransferase [Neolewinella marina]NJB86537.1 fucose 4-O-acetylase-like acetyltransferase [Neolewinella marina]PHK99009.1 hypothetical protein CGL56_05985 [Neolewinella marina]
MRIHKIDLLRSIGLLMIIAAHLSPPALLHQLRNFDVPLMVLISGASFQTSHRSGELYPRYVWKRFKRLIVPVWIFLTLRFVVFYLASPNHPIMDPAGIRDSYLLSDRIDYLWIIRVFFLVALVAPLLYRLNQKIRSGRVFFSLLFFGMGAYQLARHLELETIFGAMFTGFAHSALYYLIPYGLVYLLGMRLINLSRPVQWRLFWFFMASFALWGIGLAQFTGDWVSTQQYKYPVAFYYLSYAMAVSLLLWIKGEDIWSRLGNWGRRYIHFISRHSIWLYLWHIPLVRAAGYVDLPFEAEYPLVIVLATCLAALQMRVIEALVLSWVSNRAVIKNVRLMLMG